MYYKQKREYGETRVTYRQVCVRYRSEIFINLGDCDELEKNMFSDLTATVAVTTTIKHTAVIQFTSVSSFVRLMQILINNMKCAWRLHHVCVANVSVYIVCVVFLWAKNPKIKVRIGHVFSFFLLSSRLDEHFLLTFGSLVTSRAFYCSFAFHFLLF